MPGMLKTVWIELIPSYYGRFHKLTILQLHTVV